MEPRLAEKLAKVHWYLSARNLKVHYTLWSQWITNGEVRQGTKFVLGGRLRYFGHLSHANPLSSGTCHGHTRISGHGDAPDLHRAGSIYEQLSKISELSTWGLVSARRRAQNRVLWKSIVETELTSLTSIPIAHYSRRQTPRIKQFNSPSSLSLMTDSDSAKKDIGFRL